MKPRSAKLKWNGKRKGVNNPNYGHFKLDKFKNEIFRMFANGYNCKQIASVYKCWDGTIRNLIKRSGKILSTGNKRDKNPNWNGGKHKVRGYVYILCQDHPFKNKMGYVAEHRIIMEDTMGRYLKSNEVVHHKNGIKNDNRKSNLELLKSNSKHFKKYHLIDRDKLGRFKKQNGNVG